MTHETETTTGQRIALDNFLSEYPKNMSWQEIITALENEDANIIIWEPFADYPINDMLEWLESLAGQIDESINETIQVTVGGC